MLERSSRMPGPRCRATAAHRKAVTESPPHAKKELCKLIDPWPKTCQPKISKCELLKIFGKCWHLPNVDLAWHPIGPVFNVESCRLGDSRRQRFLLPITAMKKGGKGWPNDEDRLWGNPGGEVIETCSPDSWLKFSVSVSIDEYFTHSWLEEEFWPGIIMVMLKERCFLIFKVEFFKYVQMTWQAVSRPRDFLVLQGCCQLMHRSQRSFATIATKLR